MCCVLLFLVNVHESWLWKDSSVVFGVKVLPETLLECRAEQHLWHSTKPPHDFRLRAAGLYHLHGPSNSWLLLICVRWDWRRGTSTDCLSVLSQEPQIGLTTLLCGPLVELFCFWSRKFCGFTCKWHIGFVTYVCLPQEKDINSWNKFINYLP